MPSRARRRAIAWRRLPGRPRRAVGIEHLRKPGDVTGSAKRIGVDRHQQADRLPGAVRPARRSRTHRPRAWRPSDPPPGSRPSGRARLPWRRPQAASCPSAPRPDRSSDTRPDRWPNRPGSPPPSGLRPGSCRARRSRAPCPRRWDRLSVDRRREGDRVRAEQCPCAPGRCHCGRGVGEHATPPVPRAQAVHRTSLRRLHGATGRCPATAIPCDRVIPGSAAMTIASAG